ncbi:hypothetical protein ACU8KH_00852 [Lachancea thermotolerans]
MVTFGLVVYNLFTTPAGCGFVIGKHKIVSHESHSHNVCGLLNRLWIPISREDTD